MERDIIKTLTQRDGVTREEAIETTLDARERVLNGDDVAEILLTELGLEEDYIFELLFRDFNKTEK